MSSQSTSSLSTLPIELVYRILDHLQSYHILVSTYSICARWNLIIDAYQPYQVIPGFSSTTDFLNSRFISTSFLLRAPRTGQCTKAVGSSLHKSEKEDWGGTELRLIPHSTDQHDAHTAEMSFFLHDPSSGSRSIEASNPSTSEKQSAFISTDAFYQGSHLSRTIFVNSANDFDVCTCLLTKKAGSSTGVRSFSNDPTEVAQNRRENDEHLNEITELIFCFSFCSTACFRIFEKCLALHGQFTKPFIVILHRCQGLLLYYCIILYSKLYVRKRKPSRSPTIASNRPISPVVT